MTPFHVIFSFLGSIQSFFSLSSRLPPSINSKQHPIIMSSQQTPTRRTTLGWRSSFVKKHSKRNLLILSLSMFVSCLMATFCPSSSPSALYVAKLTVPKAPCPSILSIFTLLLGISTDLSSSSRSFSSSSKAFIMISISLSLCFFALRLSAKLSFSSSSTFASFLSSFLSFSIIPSVAYFNNSILNSGHVMIIAMNIYIIKFRCLDVSPTSFTGVISISTSLSFFFKYLNWTMSFMTSISFTGQV
mmetsp:Transcript_23378/g.48660  ORF Transcript_23378/g.48660 Transcript_23378/m.48660 type:complete len:245 (-) Transcript_23378:2511-3245(-)